ncbi:DnaA regulatory inactivator Hda [Guyparkeria hydrothermalis]|uniref:DnaA regulatory inactivator Hda n=1 Tax=Guyparkeria TaxID=2035712 RepID=UPI0010AB5109|nr:MULTISPECIES: DnaA regulatory inactivator Hda [Guyparkeria]MCL7751469.1 DnaA regulatory inactivator Hda [Guyparkeria hydrothermalis]TKA88559.1 DnaA regulatory inactivator Hda [Guyparkeria sp. SB14A]
MQQIPLALDLVTPTSFEGFIGNENLLLKATLAEQAAGSGETQVLIHGPAGAGKSHLAQAACYHAGSMGRPAAYWPLRQLGGQLAAASEQIEAFALAVIDDVDAVIGQAEGEFMLFDLINRAREAGVPLLLTASHPPTELPVKLADLASRLTWGAMMAVHLPGDGEKIELLRARAQARGLEMPHGTAQWMLAHLPRDVGTLLDALDRLDRESMIAKRRLTIPFVREVLIEGE